ncbi:alveolin domain containing intermediate filament IMC7 [Toxoplasma gondii TgCatPRC2]|uniref:Alveolin domain containing intermediate filament IMC7 n=15 Tax=Toxoplasma gondii TaxID=5811 RepID=B9PYT6_TOXGV|nr:alveolin domain containing intermediate filament IMC7 [Toxoplasma gondii GT1]ESS30090.1 alveolin domain containing intermediate filament IMC7 [Toxoplasma gondii VEG]KAF4645639.1 alveolin domain containing intermediate filament IMC7 [Toxoplasma gondii]KFG36200.1 alveolin domain containing intermediate filament IMC7 [Toxoplasma gondii p89]KFG41616.1 alveolin domain containing intermediate filament IMC7 [Toxoplasma gondii GAB2-2007-GAL-DOM2]KFG47700.1 alveolin domain containing intermediate fi
MEFTADNAAPLTEQNAPQDVEAVKPDVIENAAETANEESAAPTLKRLVSKTTHIKTVTESLSRKQTKEITTNTLHMGWKETKEAFLAPRSTITHADGSESEIARFVPSVQVVDLPLDLVYTVPEVKTRMVNYIFECPARGHSRLVPREFPVDTPFVVPQYQDVSVPVVMSQTFVPELQETSKVVQVPVARYVPKLVPVDVFVPRPVAIPIKAGEVTQVSKNTVISDDLMRQLSVEMNPHLEALNQFNAQQAQVMNNVVARAQELATQMDCPVPSREKIEVNASAGSGAGATIVDEQGNKQLQLDMGGKELRSVEMVFKRLHDDINTSKCVEENMQITEDIILCVHRDLNGGRLESFPSGNAGIPMIFRAPDQKPSVANGLPERVPLRSLTNDLSHAAAAQNESATTTGEASLPTALNAEEQTTAVPIAA